MHKSIWEWNIETYPTLTHNEVCDICIVGGGLTGITLAYYLKDCPLKVLLIEQGKIGNSTTMRSTAKITFLQKDIYSSIQKCLGKSFAHLYYLAQKKAIEEIKQIIKMEKIDCDLEESPSYLFIQDLKNKKKLEKEVSLLKEFGEDIKWEPSMPISCFEKLCCSVSNTYVFHPLRYIDGLLKTLHPSKNVNIYENTRMVRLKKEKNFTSLFLDNGTIIEAKKVVFTGHYPPFFFPYLFPMKTYLKKEVVIAQNSDSKFHFNAINLDKNVTSIRFYKNQKIMVFDSKKLGKKAILNEPIFLEKFNFIWSNYDVMTSDFLPIVGPIGKYGNHLYLATGYNGWGITNSNIAAQILAKELQGENHPLKPLYSPYRFLSSRVLFHRISYAFHSLYQFIASYISVKNTAKIVFHKGKRKGIVFDELGQKHEVFLTCPHMKCGILYNPKEKTWDCPCHGSRFDIDGNLIKGPATDCIKSK